MNPKSRPIQIAAGVMVLAVLLGALVIRLADQSLTAAGARRLPCADADYAWGNTDELITFSTKETVVKRVQRGYSDDVVKVSMDAQRTNIHSGSRSSMTEFDKLFPAETPGDFRKWSVSRDGTRLLYSDKSSNPDYYEPETPQTVWKLDAGPQSPIDLQVYAGITYTCDFALWGQDSGIVMLHKNNDGILDTALYNTEAGDDATVAVHVEGPSRTPVGMTPDGRLVSSDVSTDHAVGRSIFVQGVCNSQAPLRTYTSTLPADAVVKEIALSPKGDQVAWTVSRTYTSPLYKYLKRFSPKLAAKSGPRQVISIYLSSLDCKKLRQLGMEDFPANVPTDEVRSTRWRPNGKGISYRWRHGIYLIPVD